LWEDLALFTFNCVMFSALLKEWFHEMNIFLKGF
jgi:hypothetical protein